MKKMRLGSLFDGSGGFPLAARMCGIEPVWASEIEPYPIRVTKKNFPNMKHLGDVTKINGAEIEPVDVITFGSPCQDLSVAGKQKGLSGERSGLFMEAVRIIKEMREKTDGKYPAFAVWENVPGAFSSNKREDFRVVLEALARAAEAGVSVPRSAKWKKSGEILADGWSIAWRTLDAKYWGVPQRRRRIYLVADFGGGRAGKILFEREGLQRDFKKSRKTREEAATNFGICAHDECRDYVSFGFTGRNSPSAGSIGYSFENAPTLRAGVKSDVMCLHPKITGTLCASGAGLSRCAGQANETDLVICIAGNTIDREPHNGGNGAGAQEGISYTLNTIDRHAVCYGFQSYGEYKESEVSKSLMACDDITTSDLITAIDVRNLRENGNISGTLQAKENGGYSLNYTNPIMESGIVRRFTPLECCRLQGFPDDWCECVEGSDSAQYKMWGNGIALPCALYVMEGIAEYGGTK